MGKITDDPIFFIEKNIHGAWVIWGVLGIRQYYYYTKKEAKERYIEEAKGTVFHNVKTNGSKQKI